MRETESECKDCAKDERFCINAVFFLAGVITGILCLIKFNEGPDLGVNWVSNSQDVVRIEDQIRQNTGGEIINGLFAPPDGYYLVCLETNQLALHSVDGEIAGSEPMQTWIVPREQVNCDYQGIKNKRESLQKVKYPN